MIKIPITYKNFDNEDVTEEHYFHLSKTELIDMVSSNEGEDIVAKLERVGKSGDGGLIMKTFREIIAAAYGQRVDGSSSQFFKDPDLTAKFLSSLAFDQLFMDLITNTTSAAAFVNGIMPSGLDKLTEATAANAKPAGETRHSADDESGLENPRDKDNKILPWAFREPTRREISAMTRAQMADVMNRKNSDWKPPARV